MSIEANDLFGRETQNQNCDKDNASVFSVIMKNHIISNPISTNSYVGNAI